MKEKHLHGTKNRLIFVNVKENCDISWFRLRAREMKLFSIFLKIIEWQRTQSKNREIWGFHGSENSCYDLLDYDSLQSGTKLWDFAMLQLKKLKQSYRQSKCVASKPGWAVPWTPRAVFCRLTPLVHWRASIQKAGESIAFARVLYFYTNIENSNM